MLTALYNLADLHLQGYSWSRREEFYGDSFAALASAKEVILKDPIVPNPQKAVVLSGDITNKRAIEDDTALALRSFISELYAEGIKVYYVNGNHDMSKRLHIGHVGVFGGIHINEKLTKIGDFNVYGLDWVPRTMLKEKIEKVPDCDILYLHCAFKHLLGFEGAYDLDKDDLPQHLKNVFVGDVHKTDITSNIAGCNIVSPGPLHPCALDQKGPHGLMRIMSDRMEWEFMEITTRHVLEYNLHTTPDLDAATIAESIRVEAEGKVRRPHLVLRYTSEEADLADSVASLLKDDVHIHEKKSNTGHIMTPQRKAEILADQEQTSLEREVEAFADEDPDTANFVRDLLLSPDPEKLLVVEYNKCALESEQIQV